MGGPRWSRKLAKRPLPENLWWGVALSLPCPRPSRVETLPQRWWWRGPKAGGTGDNGIVACFIESETSLIGSLGHREGRSHSKLLKGGIICGGRHRWVVVLGGQRASRRRAGYVRGELIGSSTIFPNLGKGVGVGEYNDVCRGGKEAHCFF
jgi:hypothetical protein